MQHASRDESGSDDDLIGISEAARRVGIDKSTLSRQVRDGQIRSHGGKVRLSEVLEDRAANIDLSRSGKGAAAPSSAIVDGQAMPFHVAKAMKETYLAQLRKLEFEERAGKLVDRAAAEKLFFDEARTNRDAWSAWPGRIGIELAAEVGVDARLLTQALARYVHQHLTEMGEPEGNLGT